MNFKSINKKGNLQDWAKAQLAGYKTTNQYLASVALKQYAEFVAGGGKPSNMNIVLEDDTILYVYSDTEDLTGKRVVIADADGNPTETPAPDGEHFLQDGKSIVVEDGLITEVKDTPEETSDTENMEEEKVEAMKEEMPENKEEEKTEAMKEEPKTENKNPETKMANQKTTNLDLTSIKEELKKELLSEMQSNGSIQRGGTMNLDNEKQVSKISLSKENPEFFKKPVVKKAMNVGRAINSHHHQKPFNANTIAFAGNDYSGEALLEISSRILLGANSVEAGLWEVMPNIKFKKRVTRAEFVPTFKDASSTFTPSDNDLDIDYAKIWEPKVSEAQEQIDFETLRTSYHEVLLGEGSMADYIPPAEVANWWGARMAEHARNTMDSLYWQGKKYTANYTATADYPSIIQKAVADNDLTRKTAPVNGSKVITGITQAAQADITLNNTTDLEAGDILTINGVVGMVEINGLHAEILEVIDATSVLVKIDTTGFTAYTSGGTAKYINESNIIPNLKSLLKIMNVAVRINQNAYIAIPPHLQLAYDFATSDVATGDGNYYIQRRELAFLSQRMTVCHYMMPNTIWVNTPQNNLLGLDLLLDPQTIRIIYEGAITQNDVVTAKIRVKSDVNYVFPDEVAMISGLL